jgi:hypothetical protein
MTCLLTPSHSNAALLFSSCLHPSTRRYACTYSVLARTSTSKHMRAHCTLPADAGSKLNHCKRGRNFCVTHTHTHTTHTHTHTHTHTQKQRTHTHTHTHTLTHTHAHTHARTHTRTHTHTHAHTHTHTHTRTHTLFSRESTERCWHQPFSSVPTIHNAIGATHLVVSCLSVCFLQTPPNSQC